MHNFLLVYLSISTCFGQICVTICDTWYFWYLLFCVDDCLCMHDSHPHGLTCTKCRKNTAVSPDDGPTVARYVKRLINILRMKCAPSWFYLQDAVYCELYVAWVVGEWMNENWALSIGYIRETGGNHFHCHFIYHKSHINCSGIDGPSLWMAGI
jgi:hypothetical protein